MVTLVGNSCFLANANGNNQTGISDAAWNLVTSLTNEVFDIGGYYDNSAACKWVPPSGNIRLGFSASNITGTVAAAATMAVGIFKNNAVLAQFNYATTTNNTWPGVQVMIDDVANGTDYYQAKVYIDLSSGTATLSGDVTGTYFWGYWNSE